MKKNEIVKQNQKWYSELSDSISEMTGLERLVAENLTLKWIKGVNWMGGLSDSVANKSYAKLMSMGYNFDDIEAEFEKQMAIYLK